MTVTTGLYGGTPQELDLETMHLFLLFFNPDELINDLQLLDLSIRELTIIKAVILHELAGQLTQQVVVRDAVRTRIQSLMRLLRRPQR